MKQQNYQRKKTNIQLKEQKKKKWVIENLKS